MFSKNRHLRLIVVLLQFAPCFTIAQNLVENPSFEKFMDCPVKLGNLENDVEDWNMPTLGSTDYFNACSIAMGTPENFNGKQPADFGVGYVGFYMYAPNDYREYIQGSLSRTLVKGERYTVSFYVSLAERSDFAIKEFGIRFTEFPVDVTTSKVLSGLHFSKMKGETSETLRISYSKYYSDEIKWLKLTTDFVATGTENYIIIGNFKNNKRTQKYQTKRKITKGSYYYLDMVSVINVNSKRQNLEVSENKKYQIDKIHVFETIYFDSNKSEIKGDYQQEMESLLAYLKANKNINIQIFGHTDNVGSDSFNQKLSLRRANEIVNFLNVNGIEENRIDSKGFGKSRSITSNETAAGRSLNRRVEFILSKVL